MITVSFPLLVLWKLPLKLEINRVREQRRASLEKSEATVRAIQREEEDLVRHAHKAMPQRGDVALS